MIKQFKEIFLQKKINNSSDFNIHSSYADKSLLSNDKLFKENPAVKRSIAVIANAVSSIKFKIFVNGDYVTQHELYDLLNRPNPNNGWASFIEGLITNFMIYGNAYVFFDKRDNKLPMLHNLRPDKMTIVPGSNGVASAYKYFVDGKERVFPNNSDFSFIGHIKTFHPSNDWYGLSPLEAIKLSANLHQSVTSHNLSLLQNGGRISGVVSIKNGAVPLTDQEKKDLTQNLVQAYSGPSNAGKIAFVQGGDFEWKPMGINPKDMDFVNAKMLAAREISEALGVPAILIGGVGVQGESSKANFKEIVERFHEGTVLPIAEKVFSFLNNWLLPLVDKNCSINMDLEHFLPLHDKRYELWDKVNSATFLSDKQKRILLGLDNIEAEAEVERS